MVAATCAEREKLECEGGAYRSLEDQWWPSVRLSDCRSYWQGWRYLDTLNLPNNSGAGPKVKCVGTCGIKTRTVVESGTVSI